MSLLRCLGTFVREVTRRRGPDERAADVVTPRLTAPDPAVAAHVSAARESWYRGDIEACEAAAREALKLAPGDPFASFYVAQARRASGDVEGARAALSAVIEAGDFLGLARGWLADLEARLGNHGEAWPREGVYEAIELERAARAALRRGDYERAAALAGEAIELDPSNLLAHHHLGQALLAMGRRDDALVAFEAALEHDAGLGIAEQWVRYAAAADPAVWRRDAQTPPGFDDEQEDY